jgi:hypothetical protein
MSDRFIVSSSAGWGFFDADLGHALAGNFEHTPREGLALRAENTTDPRENEVTIWDRARAIEHDAGATLLRDWRLRGLRKGRST